MKNATKALGTQLRCSDPYGTIGLPVYNTVAYQFCCARQMSDAFCGRNDMPDYSRVQNPTVSFLEDQVCALAGASGVVAFNSGMAAISNCFLAVASAGCEILTSRHLFGNTYSLITKTLARFGVSVSFCDMTSVESVRNSITPRTCAIFLEVMTNPQLEVADIRALAAISRERGIPLIVDSTAIPFTFFRGRELGVDIEIVSSTKYVSGGATSLGGLIISYGGGDNIMRTLRKELLFNIGAYMTPHAAYMQSLGLETLETRYLRQCATALLLAQRLKSLKGIVSVNYTGLEDNRFHQLAQRQFNGTYGAMLTVELSSKEECYRLIDKLRIFRRATNLFDNKSLAIHPASTIFGNFSPTELRLMDVNENIIRLSVGLEDAEDLYEDIAQALHL